MESNFKSVIAEVTPNFNKNTMYGKIRYIVDSPINYLKDKNLILILTYAFKLKNIWPTKEDFIRKYRILHYVIRSK
ncbi:hypothetical protein C3E89_07450 [Clostridium sp. Cult1]|nr:hypothetical protein [Clostridium sp. Cult1]